jgi:hypothetical protein
MKTLRIAIIGLAAFALAGTSGWAEQMGDRVFKDGFNAANQSLASYNANYTTAAGTTANLVNNKLRITSTSDWSVRGVNGYTGLGALLGGGSHGPGSFIAVDVTAPSGNNSVSALLAWSDTTAYVVGGSTMSGYYSGGWINGGSAQVPRGTETHYAIVISGGTTEHLFVNKQFNVTFPRGASGTDSLRLAIQGDSTYNVDFDNLVVGRNAYNTAGIATALKAGLSLAHSDSFNRADSGSIGTGWTKDERSGKWIIGVVNNSVELKAASAPGWDACWATLDLTNPAILGRGLQVGEYVEIKVRADAAATDASVGVAILGYPLFRCSPRTAAKLRTWVTTFGTDNPDGWNDMGPGAFDVSSYRTLGQRLDYADGSFAIVSYFIDGNYAASWLHNTTATTLNTFVLRANSGTANDTFRFDDLAVYVASPRGTVITIR